MCKKKTNKEKLNVAGKKIANDEIKEATHVDIYLKLENLAASDPVHKKLEGLF